MPSFRLLTIFASVALWPPPPAPRCPFRSPRTSHARAYVLVDYQSGRVLAGSKADVQMEPASITKLMTGYVVFRALKEGRLKRDELVTISERAWKAEGSRTFAQVGTQIPVDVLVKGMIVQSGNDATIALAEKLGGTEDGFVQMMNSYAAELGLKNSHFNDSSGLPGPHALHERARHRVAVARADPRFSRRSTSSTACASSSTAASSSRTATGCWRAIPRSTASRPATPNPRATASRAPRSAATCASSPWCSAPTSFKAREDASAALLNYGFTFFETVKAKGANDVVLKPEVYKGEEDRVTLVPANDVCVTVGRGAAAQLKTTATVKEPLIAPIKAGQALGELTVSDGKDVIARVPLVAKDAVPEGGWWTRMVDGIALWMR